MAFHGFNHIIGRLTQSTHSQPLYPLSPAPLEKVDPPKTMFYDPTNNMRRGPAPAATAQSGTASYSTVSPKIAKRFQIFNSDLPVFLLGGKKDKILFGLTFVLVGVSTLQSVFYIGGNVFK